MKVLVAAVLSDILRCWVEKREVEEWCQLFLSYEIYYLDNEPDLNFSRASQALAHVRESHVDIDTMIAMQRCISSSWSVVLCHLVSKLTSY